MIKYILIPDTCPCCGGPLEIHADNLSKNLYCLNPNCQGKLINRLDHFCGKKGLDIKGLSKATLDKLIDFGWVNNYRDILRLPNYREEWIKKPGFGDKSVDRILTNIKVATHPAELWRVIAAAGIPFVGITASKTLAKEFRAYAKFRSAVEEDFDFTILTDIGDTIDYQIRNFDYTEIDDAVFYGINIPEYEEKIKVVSNVLEGKTFVITGKLLHFKNRAELKEKIKSLGGHVTEGISKKTDYLINNDINSTSTKNKTAKMALIPIITEEQFLDLIS